MVNECYAGSLLSVDLTTQKTSKREIHEEIYQSFIGGKGLGAYLLYTGLGPGVDPLGPENMLLFMTGPLQGLEGPSVGRWTLVTKSPLTGLFLDSHCGGPLGRELKRAGLDALQVTGRAERPTVLVVSNGVCSFEDAAGLWGKGIHHTTGVLHQRHGKSSAIYTIGPAGENQVLFATGSCEVAHQTGRGGVGAVMGSKNLKAVVVSGSKSIRAADPEGLRQVSRETVKSWAEHTTGFKDRGTGFLVKVANELGQFPHRNWRSGYFPAADGLDVYPAYERLGRGTHQSCPNCIMRCTHAYATRDPDNPDREVESTIEYESIGLLGGNLSIDDFEGLLRLNYLCDDYGLDTISTGSAIGFAIEAFEHGMLSADDTGVPLQFGDPETAMRLIRMIAHRQGLGDLLANGTKRASEWIGKGSERLAVHVKGLDVAAWDPRGRRGMGLSYATAEVGGSHLRGWPATTEPPNVSAMDMVESMMRSRDEKILTDSLIVCHFTYRLPLSIDQKVRLLNAATGRTYDVDSVMRFARRVDTLTRLFNVREGASRRDDVLPEKFWTPQAEGPRAGMSAFVSREDFEQCLDRYYELRGWDRSGVPTEVTLRELGLAGLVR
ncbi:MAG: aldehyde ferredoxin oxidoreductase family protein [Candidatus Thorarchaeota archaeon]